MAFHLLNRFSNLSIPRKTIWNIGDHPVQSSEAGFAAYISPFQGYWNMTIISAPSSPVEISKR